MNLWQYDNHELLQTAQMAHWFGDDRFAMYVMEEIACRVLEEHPPDISRGDTGDRLPEIEYGETLESKVKKDAKEARARPQAAIEADDERLHYELGSN